MENKMYTNLVFRPNGTVIFQGDHIPNFVEDDLTVAKLYIKEQGLYDPEYAYSWEEIDGEKVATKGEPLNEDKTEFLAFIAANAYKDERREAYPSIQEQLDMQYWDSVNGTTTWADAVADVKAAYPKPTE